MTDNETSPGAPRSSRSEWLFSAVHKSTSIRTRDAPRAEFWGRSEHKLVPAHARHTLH